MLVALALIQTRFPPRYHTAEMLLEKILDAVRDKEFTPAVLTSTTSDPHDLSARIKLILATCAAAPLAPVAPTNSPAMEAPSSCPPTLTSTPAVLSERTVQPDAHGDDTGAVVPTDGNPEEPNNAYYVLRRLRGN